MSDFLNEYRNSHTDFSSEELLEAGNHPMDLFEKWFKEADENEREPNAFTLTTSTFSGRSSGRILYLKEIIDGQFVFYTNYRSQKGDEIDENPIVSMLFFWPQSARQIRITGKCTKVNPEVSDTYFSSRPRGSQIGAWASEQSRELSCREELENRIADLEKRFPNEVPRPDFWGGYQIEAEEIEFWQGRPSRLHDRLVYKKQQNDWKITRINP